jgi:hypothetical protein
MKKKTLILLIQFSIYILSINAFSQKTPGNENDKKNIDSIFNLETSLKIKGNSLKLLESDKKISLLTQEIERYKLNENYFSTALSTQTTIFSVIVTIIILLISFISFSKFQSDVKKVKNLYAKSINNYKKIEKRINNSDSYLYSSITVIYHQNENFPLAIYFGLKAASNLNLENMETETQLSNIKSLTDWTNNEINKNNIKELLVRKKEIFELLNEIAKVPDNDFANAVAILRTSIVTKFNNT